MFAVSRKCMGIFRTPATSSTSWCSNKSANSISTYLLPTCSSASRYPRSYSTLPCDLGHISPSAGISDRFLVTKRLHHPQSGTSTLFLLSAVNKFGAETWMQKRSYNRIFKWGPMAINEQRGEEKGHIPSVPTSNVPGKGQPVSDIKTLPYSESASYYGKKMETQGHQQDMFLQMGNIYALKTFKQFQFFVIVTSLVMWISYFIAFREPNDVDLEIMKPAHERNPFLKEKYLDYKMATSKVTGADVGQIEIEMKQVEEDKLEAVRSKNNLLSFMKSK